MNIFNALEYANNHYPNKEAIVFAGGRIDYHELHEHACRLSSVFEQAAQLRKGDRVALFLPNRPEFISCNYGALRTGAIVVSLNAMLTSAEVKFILDDCEAKLLITTRALLEHVPDHGTIASLKKILCIHQRDRSGAFALDDFLSLATPGPLSAELGEEDGAAILNTSGTRGKPKGVLLSHGNIISSLRASRRHTRMGSDDRLICYLPLSHGIGQILIMNSESVKKSFTKAR